MYALSDPGKPVIYDLPIFTPTLKRAKMKVSSHINLRQTRIFMQNLGSIPTIVTISRSSLDEFCPENQVEMIQAQMIDLLQALVGGDKLDIRHGYQEME